MFRTYEPTRDRLVAVKVFRLDVIPEQAQALADELARAAEAGLFHPSIVEPIAAGVEGTVAYRAEEYVAAESLDVAMRHYAPAALDKALPFITQLAGAIDFARAAGVGHGALHPRDIFVTPDEARATGFGVVEALERVGLRAPVRRPYSAPERIAGQAWSTPADVFSLAAIAYELLTATRPSGTGEHIGSLEGSQAGPHAARLHAVLARAMDDEPARRFPTALAFAAALEAAGRGAHATDAVRDVAAIAAPSRGSEGSGGSGVLLGSEVSGGSGRSEPAEAVGTSELSEPQRTAEPERTSEPSEPSEPPEPLDVAIERDEDEAHHALTREEEEDADVERERFADEFSELEEQGARSGRRGDTPDLLALDDEIRDAEPAAVEFAAAEDPRAFAPIEEEVRDDPRAAAAAAPYTPAAEPSIFTHTIVDDRPRPPVLPMAVVLVVGMLIGLAAGYAIFGDRAASPPQASASPQPSAGQPAAQPRSPGEFTEQQVAQQPPQTAATPPATAAPPVPAEGATLRTAEATAKPKPAAPAATRGTIVVRSTPAGASVTLNGRWRGRTPLTLDNLQFGPYTVRVVQPGYTVAREELTLSAATPERTMAVKLRRSSAPPQPKASATPPSGRAGAGVGSIYVDSRPRGARVFVDGRAVGVTPLRLGDVRSGSHTVRMELADHRTWMATKYVLAGQETTFTGSLERIR